MMSFLFILSRTAGTLCLFAVGWAGYRFAKRLRWPSAAMLGSILFLGVLNLLGVELPFFKTQIGFFSKVMSGVILGQKIDRNLMKMVRKMPVPLAMASFWLVSASILIGILLHLLAGDRLSLLTCLAASSAGGIAEMTIFAMSVGADTGVVAFFQSVRLIVLYMTLPFTAKWLQRHAQNTSLPDVPQETEERASFSAWEIIRFAIVACAGALLFNALKFPSGYMLGAMCGAGAVNLWSGKVMKLTPIMRATAQVCLGITICAGLSPRTVQMIIELFVPLVFTVTLIQCCSMALAFALHKLTRWDVMTCLLSTCPGGLSQVVFLAEDLNADALTVGVFHAVRMVSIVVLIPLIAQLLV